MIDLYQSGKPRKDMIDDDLMPEPIENLELRKENAKLKMENDILEQMALIFGRK